MNMNSERNIISASRKTDIPAFYGDWFLNRINAGFACWHNSFNNRIQETSLKFENVLGFVFWTRNPLPFLDCIKQLQNNKYLFYFLFTINCYPKYLEKFSPPVKSAIASFKKLSKLISPMPVFLRYDPIILTSELNLAYHLSKFTQIVEALSSYTSRIYISFVDLYAKTLRNLARIPEFEKNQVIAPSLNEKIELTAKLLEIAKNHGISMHTCCETDIEIQGLHKGRCVDKGVFENLLAGKILDVQTSATRKGCKCSKSVDIGAYNTCLFGCKYCYATSSSEKAKGNFKMHQPQNSFLKF